MNVQELYRKDIAKHIVSMPNSTSLALAGLTGIVTYHAIKEAVAQEPVSLLYTLAAGVGIYHAFKQIALEDTTPLLDKLENKFPEETIEDIYLKALQGNKFFMRYKLFSEAKKYVQPEERRELLDICFS